MKVETGILALVVAAAATFAVVRFRAQAADMAQLRAAVAAIPTTHDDPPPATTVVQYVTTVAPHDAPSALAASAPAPSAIAPPPPTSEDRNAAAAAEVDAERIACEQSFRSQAVDPSWASGTTRRLTDDVRSRLSERSSLRSLDCRSATCRMEMNNADPTAYHDDVRRLFMSDDPVWKGPFFATTVEKGADGSLVSIAYLVREGGSLPSANASN